MKVRRAAAAAGLVAAFAAAAAAASDRCAMSCLADVAACTQQRCVGQHGRDRRRCVEDCKGRNGCPARIRTLAYVVTRCRTDAAGLIGWQEVRIRRGDCDPVTVAHFETSTPVADPVGLCAMVAGNRAGFGSSLAGVVQHLSVSPDGSTVVFDVTTQFQLIGKLPLPPEAQGLFVVRADGSGLRRLGPASQQPAYRIFTYGAGTLSANFEVYIPFSPSGRKIAYVDAGPGPDGADHLQVFVQDVDTGRRTQATRLPGGVPVKPSERATSSVVFVDEDTVEFLTYAFGQAETFAVNTDGTRLRRVPDPPTPVGAPGNRVVPVFDVLHPTGHFVTLGVAGTPASSHPLGNGISEVFRSDAKTLLQLTNFHRDDTFAAATTADGRRALLIASADPFGTNPLQNCQLFSVGVLGDGLRQLTRFDEGAPSVTGCEWGEPPGCAIGSVSDDPRTHELVFDSNCNPFGTNPNGEQIFAMRPDGSALRQLTQAPGGQVSADGVAEVEIVGPSAYSVPVPIIGFGR